jgi:hypothetical protein
MSATRSALALLFGFVVTVPASAAEIVGVIARVDPAKNELLVEGRGRSRGEAVTLVCDGDTQVLFGKQTAVLADVPVGRRAHVTYETRDNRMMARVVRVNGPKPKAAAPAPDKGAITGVLRRVALTDREVVVIGPGPMGKETETTVAVPETARIMKGGKAATLESLKEDDPVSIVAEKRDGRLTATVVQVGPPAKSDTIEKLRLAIKIADFLLERMQKSDK